MVVVPVKEATRGKTRLADVLEPGARAALVRAMALDTVEAVAGCTVVARVLVVTGDPVVAASATRLPRVGVLAEPPGQFGDTGWAALDRATAAGVRRARAEAPGAPCAVLLGDLPGLDPAELAVALAAASPVRGAGDGAGSGEGDAAQAAAGSTGRAATPPSDRVMLVDAEGTGTTLLTVGPGVAYESRFGTGSAAAHQELGYRLLDLDLPTLRQDVDVPADLARVIERGVGGRTQALLERLAPLPIPSSATPTVP